MARWFLVALLALSLVTCPLRCQHAVASPRASDESAGNCCCRHLVDSGVCLQKDTGDLPRSRESEDKCRCNCLCNGATLAEKQVVLDGGALHAVFLIPTSSRLSVDNRRDHIQDESHAAAVLRAGKPLRLLLASLQI